MEETTQPTPAKQDTEQLLGKRAPRVVDPEEQKR
jgi:hypothetical protein